MAYSTVPVSTNTEMATDTFSGYNHNLKIGDGELYDMKNLTSDYYPLMANRDVRNIVCDFHKIYGMTADGDGNIYVVGDKDDDFDYTVKLYKIYRNAPKGDYTKVVDITTYVIVSNSTTGSLELDLEMSKKQMMIFGNYLLIFPDNIMILLNDSERWYKYHGYLDASPVRAVPCDAYGEKVSGTSEYVNIQFSPSMKSSPVFLAGDTVRITGLGSLDGVHAIKLLNGLEPAADYYNRYVIDASLSEVTYYTTGEWYMSREWDSGHSGDSDEMDRTIPTWWAKTMAVSNMVDEATYPVTLRPCNAEGETITGTASKTAPAAKEGAMWADTSGSTVVWKKYSGATWIALSDVYVCVSFTAPDSGVGAQGRWPFEVGDAVKFSGIGDLDGVHTIIGSGATADNSEANSVNFWITGVISEAKTFSSGVFSMNREVPKMDYIVQAENRLWGCKYGESTGANKTKLNEIYACKLGDPTNWNVYQGISTDSYTASCGTPGKFTGAVALNGYPIFFKENYYHKVYISSSGAHQILSKQVDGVQDGCSGSVAVVGDTCFYKSRRGVMAFDGSQAYTTGNYFGNVVYSDAVGGACDGKYYISMRHGNTYTIFAYDTSLQLWHKEDDKRALAFASSSLGTFMFTNETLTDEDAAEFGWKNADRIYAISKYISTNTKEDAQEWEAITGLQGYTYTGQKYITRFNLRMMLPKGSSADVYVEYDSSGKWEHQGTLKGTGTTTFMLPVKPRRCDHFRIKLHGKGDIRLYSISKLFEGGTDIR